MGLFAVCWKTESWQNVREYMPTLTKEIITAAILGFEEQKRKLDEQIGELRAMLPGSNTDAATETSPVRRKMSAATRKAMAEGQRKRWAAAKGGAEPKAPEAKPAKKKRVLSAEGKANIVAALKKRWAAKKAAAKKSAKG
jgi:hypothetical protein